jgi:hypothetical protein
MLVFVSEYITSSSLALFSLHVLSRLLKRNILILRFGFLRIKLDVKELEYYFIYSGKIAKSEVNAKYATLLYKLSSLCS